VSAAIIHVLGRRLAATVPVPVFGALLGYSRSQSFRVADTWPCVGDPGARRVIVPAALDALGIPYECEETDDADRD
jgi:hypothetical protein